MERKFKANNRSSRFRVPRKWQGITKRLSVIFFSRQSDFLFFSFHRVLIPRVIKKIAVAKKRIFKAYAGI